MNFDDFLAKYDGRFVDFDGAYGAQCVDLMNRYLVDVLNIQNPIPTLPGETANEIYQNFKGSSQFTKIANTPDGVPQKGDIVFWDTTVGSAGHVDLFIEGTQNNFIGFDQNWPVGSPCHQEDHNYSGVVGWLHPKAAPSASVAVDGATFQKLVHNSTLYDAFNAAGYPTIDDVIKKAGELTNEIGSLKTQLQAATADVKTKSDQAANLAAEIQKIHADDSSTASQLLDAQHQTAELQAEVGQVVKLTSSKDLPEALDKIQADEKIHNQVVKQYNSVLDALMQSGIYKRAPKGAQGLMAWVAGLFS